MVSLSCRVAIALCAAVSMCAAEAVPFNRGWRFHFGHAPTGDVHGCPDCVYPQDIGGYDCVNMEHDPDRFSAYDCATSCCYDVNCKVWQHDGDRACLHGWANATCVKSSSGNWPSGGLRRGEFDLKTQFEFANRSFADAQWPIVDAPHDFVAENSHFSPDANQKHGYLLRNVSWYRKHFRVPHDWSGSIIAIEFEGIFHFAQFWLNGVYLGFHRSEYTGFTLRLDNLTTLAYGGEESNVLAIRVDATYGSGHWYEGGGLYRPVHLIRQNATAHIVFNGLFVEPVLRNNGSQVHASVEIEQILLGSVAICAEVTLWDEFKKTQLAQTRSNPIARQSAPQVISLDLTSSVKLTLWSLKSPALYTVTAHVVACASNTSFDSLETTAGFRDIRFTPDKGLFVNGESVNLKGFSHHHSFAGVGVAVPERVNLFHVQSGRALGNNAWRMSHNPYVRHLYALLSATGVVVWDENRNYGRPYAPDMHDMVKEHRNYPAIIMWSYCNEFECHQINNVTGYYFHNAVYSVDQTRVTTGNGNSGPVLSTPAIDVAGFSHVKNNTIVTFHEQQPSYPTVLSECCSCNSQRLNARSISSCMEQQNSPGLLPFSSGSLGVWTLSDYYGEPNPWPDVSCNFGQFDLTGFPKAHAYWYRVNWLALVDSGDAGRPPVPETHVARVVPLLDQLVVSGKHTVDIEGLVSTPFAQLYVDGVAQEVMRVPRGDSTVWTVSVNETVPTVPCMFTEPLNDVQCKGLEAAKHAKSASECKQACCDDETSLCSVWQYMEGGTGCWIGYEAEHACTKSAPGWVGGWRSTPPVVAVHNATLVALAEDKKTVMARHEVLAPSGVATSLTLTLDVPSKATLTGERLVLDGMDAALVRVSVVDSHGVLVSGSNAQVTFSVVSGPGRLAGIGNGNPSSHTMLHATTTQVYGGLARIVVMVNVDCTSDGRMVAAQQVDVDASRRTQVLASCNGEGVLDDIVVRVTSTSLQSATVRIPVSSNVAQDSPLAVARQHLHSSFDYLDGFVG